jgi:hypothetical protein
MLRNMKGELKGSKGRQVPISGALIFCKVGLRQRSPCEPSVFEMACEHVIALGITRLKL